MTRRTTNEGTPDHLQSSQTHGADPVISPAAEGPYADVDVSQLKELLALTPTERLLRHEQALELVNELRKAGRRWYGFDPRAVITAARPRG
jgi:hypothetical protein